MRPMVFLCIGLVLLAAIVAPPNVQALASGLEPITLYAHSAGSATILNATAAIGPGKYSDVGRVVTFSLRPVLAESLNISGSVTYTLNLNASAPMSGIASAWLSELRLTGEEVPVSGSNVSEVVVLSNHTQTTVVGIGPIHYEFLLGSIIQLNVLVTPHSSATPYLVWDLPANLSAAPPVLPTSVKIPALNPTQAEIDIETTQPRYGINGTILQINNDCSCVKARIQATVIDAIGVYRLSGSLIVTAPNGTTGAVEGVTKSLYFLVYSYNGSLTPGFWRVSVGLHDFDANSYSWNRGIWVTPFYELRIEVVDQANESLQDARLEVDDTIGQGACTVSECPWNATTDSAGNATLLLPFSDVVGPLNLTVYWEGSSFSEEVYVNGTVVLIVHVPVYHFGVRPILGIAPLPFVRVELWSRERAIANATSGFDAVASFRAFYGSYTARIYYLWSQSECGIVVLAQPNAVYRCVVPAPVWLDSVVAIAAGGCAIAVTIMIFRRRIKLHPTQFSYFDELTVGGLPDACFAVVAGNAGSGKSVLLQSLAAEHLKGGRGCVYLTNTDFPSKIREHMESVGMPQELVRRLVFIDSYSAISGTSTTERFYVSSHTDLTSLGLMITKCLEELGSGVDLYIDSTTPMLSTLRAGYVVDFLQSVAGKVKANGGKLGVAVGTVIDKVELARFEEAADCVIEIQAQESKKGQTRRLRIKKLRGKPHIDKWTSFQIESGKGIVFQVRRNQRSKEPVRKS